MPSTPPPSGPLLSVRAALIFALSVVCAAAAAGLSYLATGSAPDAGIYAGGTFAGAVVFFNKIIDS